MSYETQSYETMLFEKRDHIAYLTLNRPQAINAINATMMDEMVEFFTEVRKDDGVRVIIFTGAGENGFCAGADLKEFGKAGGVGSERSPGKQTLDRIRGKRFFLDVIDACDKPIIVGIHGYAPAGGTELAVCCDMVVASEDATFALKEAGIGAFCAGAFTRLPEWVGKGRAKELILTAGWFTAAEMYRWGLVNRLVSKRGDIMPECEKLAQAIVKNAPLSVWFAKKVINESYTLGHEQSIHNERNHGVMIYAADDFQEQMAAMREKRPPQFKGR